MTDHPIIFSAPMVRALLDGRKTQTRRLAWREPKGDKHLIAKAAPWLAVQPGDRLWVREACWTNSTPDGDGVRYAADHAWRIIENTPEASAAWSKLDCYGGYAGRDNQTDTGMRVPSIHMPRWASRLTLTVRAVKVERLQEISEEDACAEGAPHLANSGAAPWTDGFAYIWDTIHKPPHAWADNPEVVAVTFDVARRNIDHA